jgi:hypothetical protein
VLGERRVSATDRPRVRGVLASGRWRFAAASVVVVVPERLSRHSLRGGENREKSSRREDFDLLVGMKIDGAMLSRRLPAQLATALPTTRAVMRTHAQRALRGVQSKRELPELRRVHQVCESCFVTESAVNHDGQAFWTGHGRLAQSLWRSAKFDCQTRGQRVAGAPGEGVRSRHVALYAVWLLFHSPEEPWRVPHARPTA